MARPTAASSRIAKRFEAAVKSALGVLEGCAEEGGKAVEKEEVKKALDKLVKDARNVALFWAVGKLPKVEEGAAVVKEMEGTAVACILLLHGASASAGPTLLASQRTAMSSLAHSLISLVHLVCSPTGGEGKGQAAAQVVGKVEEECGGVKRVLVDNRSIIGRTLVGIAASIKDVVREMNEIDTREGDGKDEEEGETKWEEKETKGKVWAGESSSGRKLADEEREEVEEEEEDVTFDEGEEWTTGEKRAVGCVRAVCEAVLGFVKEVILLVARLPEPSKERRRRGLGVSLAEGNGGGGQSAGSGTGKDEEVSGRGQLEGGSDGGEDVDVEGESRACEGRERDVGGSGELRSRGLGDEGTREKQKCPSLQNKEETLERSALDDFEEVLGICRSVSLHVEEIGASAYPPQEIPNIRAHSTALWEDVYKLDSILTGLSMHSSRIKIDTFVERMKVVHDALTCLEEVLTDKALLRE